MSLTKPIPIRLDDALIARLDSAAKRTGHNRASLIRLLITSWLDSFESRGQAVVPPDWPKMLRELQQHKKLTSSGDNLNKKTKNNPGSRSTSKKSF